MVPDEIRRLYQGEIGLLEMVAVRVSEQLAEMCSKTGYGFAPRPNLIKSLESTAAKLESGRFARWTELDDLVACTIIIPTRAAENEVLAFLRERFQEYETRSRLDMEQDPSVFRFGATRFIGNLRTKVPDNQPLLRFRFEVQIRTAFEHAWSVATHALSYKGKRIDWRIERLAAQLKASVEQLDMLVNSFEANAVLLETQPYPAIDAQIAILEHFREYETSGALPSESVPHQWSIFAKNVHALLWKNKGKCHPRDFPELVNKVLAACDTKLSNGKLGRSISLFQLVLGVLLEDGFTGPTLANQYFAVVTPSLEMCFPSTSSIPSKSRCVLALGE